LTKISQSARLPDKEIKQAEVKDHPKCNLLEAILEQLFPLDDCTEQDRHPFETEKNILRRDFSKIITAERIFFCHFFIKPIVW
jgi:hypothetical protein